MGELCKHTLSAQGTHTAQPPLWSLLCPHPGLRARTLCPEGRRRSWQPPGQCQGTVLREAGLAAEGAGLWKPLRVGFSCVPWSKLLNASELRRAGTQRRKRLPCRWAGARQSCQQLYYRPTRDGRACGITPDELCVCLPLPSTDPEPSDLLMA